MIIYKARSKSELAQDAGVSLLILRQWLDESYPVLEKYGVTKTTKVLPPAAVKYLSETYGIMPGNASVI